jgi:hypothetical protein
MMQRLPMLTTGEESISWSPLMPAVRQTFGPINVSLPIDK